MADTAHIGDVEGVGRFIGVPSRSSGKRGTLADLLYLVRRDHAPVADAQAWDRTRTRFAALDRWYTGGAALTGPRAPALDVEDVMQLAARVAVCRDRGTFVPVVGVGFKPYPGQRLDPTDPRIGATVSTSAPGSTIEDSGADGPWWSLLPGLWWLGQKSDAVETGWVTLLLTDGTTFRFRCFGRVDEHPLSTIGWSVVPWPVSKHVFNDLVTGVGKMVKLASSLSDGTLDIADAQAAAAVVQEAVHVATGGDASAFEGVSGEDWELIWSMVVNHLVTWLTTVPGLSAAQVSSALRACSIAWPPLAPRFNAVADVCDRYTTQGV